MSLTRRVYVSMPADRWLSGAENDLKWAIVRQIEEIGYKTEIFFDPRPNQQPGLAASKAWSAAEADAVARRCVGAAIIGMPRWVFGNTEGEVRLPTEFNYYEGAVAYTLGLPLLVLVEQDVLSRVVFDRNFSGHVGVFPSGANSSWLATGDFRVPFGLWKHQLDKRRDIFLGYSSTSTATAKKLKQFLKTIGANVLDWQTDFTPGRTILQEIEEASARCSAGIFLFTEDDKIGNGGSKNKAVPRDNVVFEAGYFIASKGKDHVLVVREAKAKMPADLGGDIYASLPEKAKITPIKETVRRFVERM